jgi:hypothetical protein
VVSEQRTIGDALRRVADETGTRIDHRQIDLAALRGAIHEYRAMFHRPQLASLQANRRLALEAMDSLADFQPRLTGALVHGDGPLDVVRLMLVADTAETVMMALADRRIPCRSDEVMLEFPGTGRESRPCLTFEAGDVRVELLVLTPGDAHRRPLERIGRQQPIQLLDRKQLAALLETGRTDA